MSEDAPYGTVGHTAVGPVAGFGWFERSTVVERRDFEAAADELLSWQLQARADCVVLTRIGIGALSLRIPCRWSTWSRRSHGRRRSWRGSADVQEPIPQDS